MAATTGAIPVQQPLAPSADSGSSWAEAILSDLLWFVAGFALIRLCFLLGLVPRSLKLGWLISPRAGPEPEASRRRRVLKGLRADTAAGQTKAVLAAWDREKAAGPLPLDLLRAAAQAAAALAPERLAAEFTSHLQRHTSPAARPTILAALTETVAHAGQPELAEELVATAEKRLRIPADVRCQEALMAGYALAGDEGKVDELMAKFSATRTARSYALVAKAFLQSHKVDAAVRHLLEMHGNGLEVPPRAVTELFRVACGVGVQAVQGALAAVDGKIPLPTDCLGLLLGHFAQHEDPAALHRIEKLAHRQGSPASYNTYEPLLKFYAKVDGTRARELFAAMQRDGFFATEGLCGNLLARCSEVQNLAFAEDIAAYLRSRSMMTLATYKTLMKVYACCGLLERACGLYPQALADGIEPDHVMYGCLVKFAVKCGDTKLSKELFDKADGGDVQNYMWLIRAAGRDGNVDRALRLLRRLEDERPADLDIAAYNCALDACVTNGAMDRAQELLAVMRKRGMFNLITFNTLMKGHCAQGALQRARNVISEICDLGFVPDSASYNCLLGTAVAAGNCGEVWDIFGEMESKHVPVDHYTVSIMMKMVKKARSPREADRALAVLDTAGVRLCEDDVLFNTVVDACVHRRDRDRLGRVLEAFEASRTRPSVHTYGLLFKAYSVLKRIDRCQQLWRQMVERGTKPTDITLSCMLDALVCAGLVDQAVALFREWKASVPPNMVIYSTLLKGFASVSDAGRAMEVYHEMVAQGHKMNLVSYTALIDAQAKAGDMRQAAEIFQRMEADGCEPNTITFSALVKGHCLRGDLREALKVFQQMLGRGLSADTVIFNTMLDGCVRHSRFELADQLLTEMRQYKLQPSNVTVSIVVKMWGKRRRLEDAFQAVRAALREGKPRLDSQVGTCLVNACLYNRDVDRALEAFEEVRTWSDCGGPDAGTFGTLIAGLARHGRARSATELAVEACQLASGPRPALRPLSEETLRHVAQAIRQHGLAPELGPGLAEAVRGAGLPLGLVAELLAEADGDYSKVGGRRSGGDGAAPTPRWPRAGRRERC